MHVHINQLIWGEEDFKLTTQWESYSGSYI